MIFRSGLLRRLSSGLPTCRHRKPPFMSEQTSSRPGTQRFFDGRVVVGVTVLARLAAAGARSAPGVFLLPMEQSLELSRGTLSLAVSLGLRVFGLAAPLSGSLMTASGRAGLQLPGCWCWP